MIFLLSAFLPFQSDLFLSSSSLLNQSPSSSTNLNSINSAIKPTISELPQYVMNVTFFTNNASLINEMNFSYINTENVSLNFLFFNLWPNSIQNDSLHIASIVHKSQNLNYSFSGLNNSFLSVNLTQTVNPGIRYNLTINYWLSLPYTQFRFGYQLKANGSTHDMYALTNWYPILAVYESGKFVLQPYFDIGESFYSDMAFYNVTFHTDNNLVIASGGELQLKTNDSKSQICNYLFFPAREISFILSPDFLVSSLVDNNITFYSFYFPEDTVRGIQALNISSYSVNLFSRLFIQYPYGTMSTVDMIEAGMEYSGLVLIPNSSYNTSDSLNPYSLFEGLIAHEISHNWDTYIVANNPFVSPWIDEGFSQYVMNVLYPAFRYSNTSADYNFTINKQAICNGIANDANPANKPIGYGLDYYLNHVGYRTNVYLKGMFFYGFLQSYLGNSLFFAFLKQIYNQFAYKTINNDQFLQTLNLVSSKNLTWIFDFFIYNVVYIHGFSVSNTQVETINSTSNKVTFTLTEDANTIKGIDLPIQLEFDNGNTTTYSWVNQSISSITINVNTSLGTLKYISIDHDLLYFRDPANFIFSYSQTSTSAPTSIPTSVPTSTSTKTSSTSTSSSSELSNLISSSSKTNTSNSFNISTSTENTNTNGFQIIIIVQIFVLLALARKIKR